MLEERVSGSVDRQYMWGLRYVDDLILCDYAGSSGSSSSSSGGSEPSERRYALQDALFNVVALADPVTGEAIERYAYHPYGRVTILDGDTLTERPTSLFDNPDTFTGRRFDPETGLYYYRARYYHPTLGRFLTRDPLGYVDGPGLYEYVSGGPIAAVDPWGLQNEQHHWIAQSLREAFRERCSEFNLSADMFVTWLTESEHSLICRSNSSADYHKVAARLFNDTATCCDFLLKLSELIRNVTEMLDRYRLSNGLPVSNFHMVPYKPFELMKRRAEIIGNVGESLYELRDTLGLFMELLSECRWRCVNPGTGGTSFDARSWNAGEANIRQMARDSALKIQTVDTVPVVSATTSQDFAKAAQAYNRRIYEDAVRFRVVFPKHELPERLRALPVPSYGLGPATRTPAGAGPHPPVRPTAPIWPTRRPVACCRRRAV